MPKKLFFVVLFSLLSTFSVCSVFASETSTSVRYELDTLVSQVNGLVASVDKLKTEVIDNNVRIQNVEMKLSDILTQMSNLDAQVVSLESQVIDLNGQVNQHIAEWNTFKQVWSSLNLALNTLISNVQRLLGPGPGANLVGKTYADIFGENSPPSHEVDLRGANLTDADLSGIVLSGANFMGATLIRANLTDADLSGADLTFCDLRGVTWYNAVCPDGSNSSDNYADGNTCVNHLEVFVP